MQQHKWSNEFSECATWMQLLLVCSARDVAAQMQGLWKVLDVQDHTQWDEHRIPLHFSLKLLVQQKEWEGNGNPRNGKAWQGIRGSLHSLPWLLQTEWCQGLMDSSNMKCHKMNIRNTALSLQCQTHSSVPTNLFWMQIYSYRALVKQECDLFLNMQVPNFRDGRDISQNMVRGYSYN